MMTQKRKNPVNLRPSLLLWKSIWMPVVIGVSCGGLWSRADDAGNKAVAEARQTLRKEGFKTDLSDFDLSTTPELRAREAILMTSPMKYVLSGPSKDRSYLGLSPKRQLLGRVNSPDLMETMDSNSAAVVWKLVSPETPLGRGQAPRLLYSWDDFRKAIDVNGPRLDRTFAAILAGPIRFDLTRHAGRYKIPPPLDQIKALMRLLDNRLVLALHDGNLAAAWTNLLAATRLVTAWEPGPLQKCQLARFEMTELAFEAAWQGLQTNGWSDAQLARLQAEWESVDYFTRLADTLAYQCASDVDASQRARNMPKPNVPFGEFMAWALRFPVIVWTEVNGEWRREQYLQHGSYVDDVTELLQYQNAEFELRRVLQAATWSDMLRILGGIRPIPFNQWAVDNKYLLGRASVAEAQRRILITALALERYRARRGKYPQSLSLLAPEFLSKPLVDFMDGQPLRYRLTDDPHFVIYSVGLNCADDEGRLPLRERPGLFGNEFDRWSTSAIVWPLPASFAAVEAIRLDGPRMNDQRLRARRP